MKRVISTRELIQTLQQYERINGIGIVIGFSDNCNAEPEYTVKIANKSEYGLIDNPKYQPQEIKISACDIGSILV